MENLLYLSGRMTDGLSVRCPYDGGLERWQSIENSAEHPAREKHY